MADLEIRHEAWKGIQPCSGPTTCIFCQRGIPRRAKIEVYDVDGIKMRLQVSEGTVLWKLLFRDGVQAIHKEEERFDLHFVRDANGKYTYDVVRRT